ncbi:ScbR family autoregulator-binding transcription factor [Streptomyces sp. NPDC005573]|uniref:ScbR family autoregulator-binding transcription factor n=1 Tax=unclassified Streptomyces TaxID=2593676 RepID=UPI0033B11503
MTQQERAVRTRRDLINSAADVFNHRGFALASLMEISSRAGVSYGALHFHFKNKRMLGEEVERTAYQLLREIVERRQLHDHPLPLQLLVDTSHRLAQRVAENSVLRAGFRLGSDATWEGEIDLRQEWCNWVESVLRRSREQGGLASDVVLEDAASTITAAIIGFEVLGRAEGNTDGSWCSRHATTRFWDLMLPRLASTGAAVAFDTAGGQVKTAAVQG